MHGETVFSEPPTVIWGCVGVQAELSNLITPTPPVGECATVSFLFESSAFTPTQLSPSYLAYYLATSDINQNEQH